MFAKTSIFALAATAALLPATLAQISDDFESGWSNATWPVSKLMGITLADCLRHGLALIPIAFRSTLRTALVAEP